MSRLANLLFLAAVSGSGSATACSSGATTAATTTGNAADSVPAVFQAFDNGVEVSRDGNYVVLHTIDVPDHKSPYFPTTDARYAPYDGSNPNFVLNPNRITAQQMTFRIPVAPAVAASHSATPLGPIGIAVNGVVLFNQYNAGSQPLTVEINGFDQYNGHPQQTGVYHYHVEPTWLTSTRGADALIGFLLDGFPVYGPMENGKTITNADLDAYHGHISATKDYPGGIYHYHITSADPYINGSGFYGTPGTVAQ
jgi:hypothetical protein